MNRDHWLVRGIDLSGEANLIRSFLGEYWSGFNRYRLVNPGNHCTELVISD